LIQAADSLGACVIDIRLRANSRMPQWRGYGLGKALGINRYSHVFSLGNPGAFDDGTMRLADEAIGIRHVEELTASRPAILLCGCRDPGICHRSMVANKLRDRGHEVVELEWPKPE